MIELQDRLRTALTGRYAVEREIGRGGMATVYLAEDLKHHRQVAIKVLHPELAASVGGDRFLREIEIAASLEHPHILSFIDSGEADGLFYYVMPYVDGESLRERIQREKQLTIGEAIRIAGEVADGLGYAHRHGVVHRDIKPANIMLTEEHALIADFGVARAVGADGQGLTSTGLAVGTPAYMSPEQASGAEDVDARSDMYALGCVLYEMLAGEPPLVGPTPQATAALRLTETATSLPVLRETVPGGLDQVVTRTLAKSPADRYATADELGEALAAPDVWEDVTPQRRVGRLAVNVIVSVVLLAAGVFLAQMFVARDTSPAAASWQYDPKRIAVLYFDDFSERGELGYVANGLTDAVIHELDQVEALQVISRNGVRQYRESPAPLDSIARTLNAGTVIEGSVTRSGEQLRVTARIVETNGMTPLRSLSLDRPWGDWLAIVDEVVEEIALQLRAAIGEDIRLREERAGTTSPEAWAMLQRAGQLREDHRSLWIAGDVEAAESALRNADSLLANASTLDPSWAEPVVARGWLTYDLAMLLGDYNASGRLHEQSLDQAVEFAEQAMRLGRDTSQALLLRGVLLRSESDLRAAVQADSSLALGWAKLAEKAESRGDFVEARRAAEKAYRLDAFLDDAQEIIFRLGSISLQINEVDDALYWAEEGRRRFPDVVDFVAVELAALTQGGTPDANRAWLLLSEVERLTSPQHDALFAAIARMQVAAVLARAGLEDSARSVIERTRAAAPDDPRHYVAYDEAHAWLLLRDHDQALLALTRYLDANPGARAYIAVDPWFTDLHGNPRFESLVVTAPSIAEVIRPVIDEHGVQAGITRYRELKESAWEDYSFVESELNGLGYQYLRAGKSEIAIAVFKLNVEVYPAASNTHDSLGEAYMEAGQTELAIQSYRRSLELNPGNDNAQQMLERMGVDSDHEGEGERVEVAGAARRD